MGRHRARTWFAWLWRIRRDQARADAESAAALELARKSQRNADLQNGHSRSVVDRLTTLLEGGREDLG